MEKLVLTIIEERNTFIEALRYLSFLKVYEITDNEDIMHYVDQMLNPDNREEVFDDIEN